MDFLVLPQTNLADLCLSFTVFQNVHVMIFIGFGFLMTFLKKYGYSAVSVTFFIAALVLQWHMIFKNLIEMSSTHKYIYIGMKE